jgi:hypothetical protein
LPSTPVTKPPSGCAAVVLARASMAQVVSIVPSVSISGLTE